jgi:hypothetical protein
MVIVLMAAALVGGLAAFAALLPFGLAVALVGAPWGGSGLALFLALAASRAATREEAEGELLASPDGAARADAV